ncbi:TM2 domain-containing protein [Ureaplasma urealyticum]|uniref:TM2 domain-containing protein n=1 Tax=Ureaplasma urealyticum TaxID=2130 RepID=UPI00307DE189
MEVINVNYQEKSTKSALVVLLLAIFLGGLGIDRFYGGRIGLGILKLFFGWIFIWWLIDVILAALGRQRDNFGRPISW